MILSQVMAHPKKQCFDFPSLNLQSKLFWENFIFFKLPQLGPKLFKLYRLGVFWNPQDLLLMMGTEIFKIDASWAEKLTKTRVSFLTAPTVHCSTTARCDLSVSGRNASAGLASLVVGWGHVLVSLPIKNRSFVWTQKLSLLG